MTMPKVFSIGIQTRKKITIVIVHSSGVFKKGLIEIEDGLLTMEGKISFPDRTFDFKNTFEFCSDGKMIDKWYQNAFGQWMAGHVITFITSESIE